MARSFFFHEDVNNENEIFTQKADQVNEFNCKMYTTVSIAAFVFAALCLASTFMPFSPLLGFYASENARVVYFAATGFYAISVLIAYGFKSVILKISLPFLYILYFSLYVLVILLNIMSPNPYPFTLLTMLRVLCPLMIIDRRIRMNISNNIVISIAVFYFSYVYKPISVFYVDVILAGIGTFFGTMAGGEALSNRVRYLQIHDEQVNQAVEVEKAKGEAKTAFLAHMSHEIRTPVNSILGLNEIIMRETTEQNIKEYAHDIQMSGATLLKIINDILDFSKIESGKLEILPAEYELSSTITDLINMTSQKALEKKLELVINVDENIPHLLFGDELRVKQCILNVLNNAVKYTEKGSVTLNVGFERIDTGQIFLCIQVKDTGIGIRQEDLDRMFNEFERVDEKRNRTIEGSGLGLSIVKMMLQRMDSKLEVQSEYGKGSVFSFKVKQQVIWWEKIGNFNERYTKLIHSTSSYKEEFHAPTAHILVVDDTRMNLVVIEGLLKKTEIQIDTAMSGHEMLEMVTKRRYDVILLDHRMPGMSGVEAYQKMQTLENNLCAGVPCIALTANVVSGAREYYLREGFSDYLSKPIDSKELEKMLKYYIPKDKLKSDSSMEMQEKRTEELSEDFSNLEGLNIHVGLQNCGSPDVLMVALKEYYATIKSRADEIEGFAASGDIKNYTIQVHALKSSSRLIGALELSEKAAYLEKCGDEENTEEITAKTPELLTLYRSYAEKLAALDDDENTANKEPLSMEKYQEALTAIKEFASAFDFNAIDGIIESIDNYVIPPTEMERYNKIKRSVRGGDRSTLMVLLSE